MATWPAKLTASGLVSDSQAKIDSIIDMFNIPASPTDNYILKYNSSNARFEMEADATAAGSGGGWDGSTNLVVSDGVSLLTPDSTAGITFNTSGSTFGAGTDFIQVGNMEVAGGVRPSGTGQDLGSSSLRFNLYATDIDFNGTLTGIDTDDVSEGATNQYFTSTRFNDGFATKTTDDLTEGSTNKYFNGKTTSDLTEGTNLYYTDTRFDTRLATKDSDDISEGATNQYFTNARADARIQAADIGDLNNVDTTGVANNKILKYNSTTSKFEVADDTGGGIALTDLSVSTTAASGNGALSYNNTTGVFTFTPANVSGGSGGHSFYNGGTLANSGSFTPDYSNGDIQFYTGTAASSGSCTMNVPTNMTTSSILRIIIYCGAGLAAPQDFDLLFNRTSGNFLTPNGTSGFGIIRGDSRVFDIFYDGTRHHLIDSGTLS